VPRLKSWKWKSWAEEALHSQYDDRPHTIAVDTETTGLGFYDEPFAGQITWAGRNGVGMKSWYFELDEPAAYKAMRIILSNSERWVFHNAKFDLQKLLLAGIIDEEMLARVEIHDTQTQYALLDENGRKGLKDLAVRILKYNDTIHVPYTSGPRAKQFPEVYREVSREKHLLDKTFRKMGLKREDGYHLLPREVVVPYALKDTEFTLQLHEKLYPQILDKDEALQRLYRSEIQLQLVLLRMEADGFALDVPYVEEKYSEYGAKVMEGLIGLSEMARDPEFNPNAPVQIGRVLKTRGLKVENTQEATLKTLDDEFVDLLLQYRGDKKIHDYLSAIQRERRGALIHPNFNPTQARTGRMSSSKAKE
jgi:DNA polymerase I-like protein with 3'-5' exonuclease and polymerase domains